MELSELEDRVQLFRFRLHDQLEELGALRTQVVNYSIRTKTDMLHILGQDIESYSNKIELYNDVLNSTFWNMFGPYANDLQPAQHWNAELLERAEYEFTDGLAPWEFVLMRKDSTKPLRDLQCDMRKYMESIAPEPYRTHPKRGVLCLCNIQRKYFRGMYLGISSTAKLTIAAIDENAMLELELSQVYEIPDSMLLLPPQIVRCCLYTNSYIKMLWSDYFVENFIRVMRQYSFKMVVDRMQSQKLPIYVLKSLTARDSFGETYNIKKWIENVITPKVLEYKCALADELFEEGTIDSHIWDIDAQEQVEEQLSDENVEAEDSLNNGSVGEQVNREEYLAEQSAEDKDSIDQETPEPNADHMIHDRASDANSIHDVAPEDAQEQVEEQLSDENVEAEDSLNNGSVGEQVNREEYLAEQSAEDKDSIDQETPEPNADHMIHDRASDANSIHDVAPEVIRNPYPHGRHTIEQISVQESPTGNKEDSAQMSNTKVSARKYSAINVSSSKTAVRNVSAQESSGNKVYAQKSLRDGKVITQMLDGKAQKSSAGNVAVTHNKPEHQTIDPYLVYSDPSTLHLDSLPFDVWENNQDLDVLDSSDEEQQTTDILHDVANIGPTYRNEVLLCPEYTNTGRCTRLNCVKEHIYPISPHSVGSVYTYIHTERLLELPERGSRIQIRPLNIVNGFTFYAILVGLDSPDEPNLEMLHQRMQNWIETTRYEQLDLLPSLGELVLVYGQRKFWYRARIIDVGECKAKVFSLDFGTEEAVPLHRLRKINSDLLFLPPQAIRCNFYGISPKENCDLAMKEYLERLILNRVVEAEVKIANQAETELELTVYLNGKNLNGHLLQKGISRKWK